MNCRSWSITRNPYRIFHGFCNQDLNKQQTRKWIVRLDSQGGLLPPEAEPGIFVWRGQVATLIYLSRQLSHIYIHTRALFYYIYIHIYTHTFLFDKLYIYTRLTNKKKIQYFQSKLFLTAIFHKIKFIFFHFHSQILKKFYFKYKLSNFMLK